MASMTTGPIDVMTAEVLGAVQGLTEILPISSDGHVALFAMLFGVSDELPLSMVVMLNVGTLIATVVAFREDLATLARRTVSGLREPRAFLDSDEGRLLTAIAVASIP